MLDIMGQYLMMTVSSYSLEKSKNTLILDHFRYNPF